MGGNAVGISFLLKGILIGLTFVSDFLLKYQTAINVLGGSLILIMGMRLIMRKREQNVSEEQEAGGIRMFLSSFVVGITNPAAILTFLFAFFLFRDYGKKRNV